jgi:hypothetical protein
MEPIKGIDLGELVNISSEQLLHDYRVEIGGKIKKLLVKCEVLPRDIKKLETELEKVRKSYKEALDKVEKLKAGDWSVLNEEKQDV